MSADTKRDQLSFVDIDQGQQKGQFASPPSPASFPVPYFEKFENYSFDSLPKSFIDQCGSFAVVL